MLQKFQNYPGLQNWIILNHSVHYLKDIYKYILFLSSEKDGKVCFEGYSDLDFAGDEQQRLSRNDNFLTINKADHRGH